VPRKSCVGYSIQTSQWRNRFSHDRAHSFCRSRRISTCSYNDRCSRSTTAESNSCRFINRSIYYAIVSCSFNRPWPAIFASRSISQRRRHLNNRFAVAKRCEKNSLANNSWLLSLPRIELRIFLASKSELRLIIGKLPVESCSEITVSLILFARYKFFFFPRCKYTTVIGGVIAAV